MYSERHHWVYMHGETPILVSDETSRVATPGDIQKVALCARILIYEMIPAPALVAPAAAPIKPAGTAPISKEHTTTCHVKRRPKGQGDTCAVPGAAVTMQTRMSQSETSADAVSRPGGTWQRPPPSPSHGARIDRKQRVLVDFFTTLIPQTDACLSAQFVVSKELSEKSTVQLAPRSEGDLCPQSEVNLSMPIADHATCPAPALPANATPPAANTSTRPIQCGAEVVDMSRLIVLKPTLQRPTQWKPGTMGLYSPPRGSKPSGSLTWQCTLPIWKVRVDGLKPQQAMFQIADNLSPSAFYIAADDWTRKDGKE